MGRDLLDELAELRSTVPDARLQPDPVVLRGMVVNLRKACSEAKAIGIPDDFVGTMIGGLIECFRELDGLPRDDPFWEATNRRPTPLKMADFCRKLARDTPDDRHVRLMQVSVQMFVAPSFDPLIWEKLVSKDLWDASWAVYAALIGIHFGGYDTAPELMRFMTGSGPDEQIRCTISALMKTDVVWVRDWAGKIAEDRWKKASS